MADPELSEFEIYLDKTRGLQPKTVKDYMVYYRIIDRQGFTKQDIDQVFVNVFLQLHGNNSNVRGFVTNLLKFYGKDLEIRMPEKSLKDKKKKLIRPISKEEIMQLKKYFYSIGFKEGLVFDLIYQGALRRSEIPTIRINSFQWNDWFYNQKPFCNLIIHGKGDKERIVKINRETMIEILDYYTQKAGLNEGNIDRFFKLDKPIFKKLNGRIMNEHNIYDMIKRGSKKVIGRDVRPHELRHNRATELLERGASIHDIKNFLGHSSIAITEIYLHQSEKQSLKNIEKYL